MRLKMTPDLHLLHADYELRELRDGVAVLRNTETGQEIEQSIHVNLNDGVVRIGELVEDDQ